MWLIDSLAESQILAAIRRGEFDDLPGTGEALVLGRNEAVAESIRAGYRLLKTAGYLLPELQLRREINEIEALLLQVQPDHEIAASRRLLPCCACGCQPVVGTPIYRFGNRAIATE